MACDPDTLPNEAGSLCCIPPGMQAAVQSYLLAKIRGGSMDVNDILSDASCFSSCIPPGLLPRIRSYLLCQLSNTGGGEIPVPECDPDALAFLAAANITVQAQRDAICRLVASLKSQGTPAFWNSEVAIYPFVGGTAASHAVNLRNPGTYNLTYFGAPPPTHGPLGMLGNVAASAYANTGYSPRNGIPAMPLTNARLFTYHDSLDATATVTHVGVQNPGGQLIMLLNAGAGTLRAYVFEANTCVVIPGNGSHLIQTSALNSQTVAYNGGAFVNYAFATTNTPTSQIFILCYNNAGVPASFCADRISGMSIGTRALSAAEWIVYNSIWQSFQAELGRARP